MNIVALVGSVSGKKTRIALEETLKYFPDVDIIKTLNIGDYALQFSDGRPIAAYNEDTQYVIHTLLDADIVIVGTPTYQTSIPGALKNVFDLLPMNALKDKIVGIVALAGSPKHYLMVESQLKPILAYMGAILVQKYVFIEDADFEGSVIHNQEIHKRIQHMIYDCIFIAQTHHEAWHMYHPHSESQHQ